MWTVRPAGLQATSCVSERRVLEGPRNSCILMLHAVEHTRICQASVRSGQRLPIQLTRGTDGLVLHTHIEEEERKKERNENSVRGCYYYQ